MKAPFVVTVGQFNRYLAEKAPEKGCPECGVNEWVVSVDPREPLLDDSTPLQPGYLIAAGSQHALPLHTLLCSNCGYVKAFSAETVEDWVKRNG